MVVKLRLSIDGEEYSLSRQCGGWLVAREGAAGYRVGRTAEGRLSCTCPDYQHRRRGKPDSMCKHATALEAVGLIEAAPAPAAPKETPADGQGPQD